MTGQGMYRRLPGICFGMVGGTLENNWGEGPCGVAGEVLSPACSLFQAVAPCRAGRAAFLPNAKELVAEQRVREGEVGP